MARPAKDTLIEMGYEPFVQYEMPDVVPPYNNDPITDTASGAMLSRGDFASKNFRKGLSGWRLTAEGDLEANNGSFRGDLSGSSGTFSGGVTLLNTLQLPVYLVASLPTSNRATVAANDSSVGTVDWDTPANVLTYTGFLCDVSDVSGNPVTSHYVKINTTNFQLASTAVVQGIKLDVWRYKRLAASAVDHSVKLVKADGTFTAVDKADTATQWASAGTGELVSYGGATDLWGEKWTPTDINSANFGAVLSVDMLNTRMDAFGQPGLSLMRITVYFSGSGNHTGPGSVAFAANGRKNGEAASSGTGVMAFHDGNAWRACDTGATVAA